MAVKQNPSAARDIGAQQKFRISRVATLGAGIFVHLTVCWTVLSIGYMGISSLEFLGLASVSIAGFLLFGLLIGIEWNLNLEDPDMAMIQMIWALTIVVVTSHFVIELRPVVLLSGLALVVMGANGLDRNQQVFVVIYGLVGYMLSVILLDHIDGLGWVTEIVLMIAFGLVLAFGPALNQFERNIFDKEITDKNEELGQALERIKELAVRDELTGVFNRRHLMALLAHEEAMADRKTYTFSICYVDLDYFKRVNDKFGHSSGDDVLKNFARVAQEVLREVDCIARIGGEEFVLVMTGTNQADAVRGSQRLAAGLRDMQVTGNEPSYRITASIGITEYRIGESSQQMLDRADGALYEAKRTGRNRIVVAGEDPLPISIVNGLHR